jgi:diguanylate cyclase (GGDEF)-like protein
MISLRTTRRRSLGDAWVAGHNEVRPTVVILGQQEEFAAAARRHLGRRFAFVDLAEGTDPQSVAADAIVLDIESEADAIEALASLADAGSPDVPVVLLTDAAHGPDRAALLEQGALDVVDKPVAWDEFGARLQAAVRLGERLRELRLESGKDALTSLPGHVNFVERLEQEVARSLRSDSPLSLLMLDVDDMNKVNDRLGREGGDQLLTLVAQTLRSALRVSDSFFRFGRDEFVAILPDTTIGTASVVAERVLELIHAIRSDEEGALYVSLSRPVYPETKASIGVAELPRGRPLNEFVTRTEQALARARESGGNQVWRSDDRRRSAVSTSALAAKLTERERLVLGHLASRRTDREVANRMGISVGTVRSHKARIRRKLQISANVRLSDFARDHLNDLQ